MTAGQTPNTMGRARPAPIEKIAIRGCVRWLRVNPKSSACKGLRPNGFSNHGPSRRGHD